MVLVTGTIYCNWFLHSYYCDKIAGSLLHQHVSNKDFNYYKAHIFKIFHYPAVLFRTSVGVKTPQLKANWGEIQLYSL